MKKIIEFAVVLLLIVGLSFPTSRTQAATVAMGSNSTPPSKTYTNVLTNQTGQNHNGKSTDHITYYVDNTTSACDDNGAGLTPSQPFCTITTGASVAIAGDTVQVLTGTYAETVKPNSGNPGAPVTFSASPGVTVTGNGLPDNGGAFRFLSKSYIVIDGFTMTGTADFGIYAWGSDHLTISNNHVSYSGNTSTNNRCGIFLSGTTYSTITGNMTDHNSLDGIRLINGSSNNTVNKNISFANASVNSRLAEGIDVENNSTNNTIIHNITYANEDSGLNFYTGSGSNLVIGNVSYGNGDHGIDNNASPNNTIIGNTIQGNVTAGINLEGVTAPGSGGATVENNIVVDNGWGYLVGDGTPGAAGGQPGNIRVDSRSTAGTTLDYNLYYLKGIGTAQVVWGSSSYTLLTVFKTANPGQETNGLPGNPLFTAPAPIAMRPAAAPFNVAVNVGDYRINAGSPAIDSANSNAPGEPALDIEGYARVDIPSVADTGAGTRTYDDRGAYEFWYTLMLPLIIR